MRLSNTGIALIKRFEGFSPMPYLCPAGYLTIGYGHLVGTGNWGQGIGEEEAEALLRADVRIAERAVLRLIHVPLTQSQYDALVSFTFNLGSGALQRSTLRRKVNRSEHEAAAHEFAKWVFAGGKRLPGLVARRKAEAILYMELQ
jgi:GH24 family phage-related lysozyme (muramidase)